MKVYAAMYNPMTYESAAGIISLHKTKVGAYKAMRKHKIDTYNEERDRHLRYGHWLYKGQKYIKDWQVWFIDENEVVA